MKAKYINENIGGAGFSLTGGMGGRGGGFGGSSNLGGPNMMYTYEIKPLNTLLTQKQGKIEDTEAIHVGSIVRGKRLNKPQGRYYVGHVTDIKKNENGAIKYFVILSQNALRLKIDPTSIMLVNNTPLMKDLNLKDVYGDEPSEQKSGVKEGLVSISVDKFIK